MHLLLLTFCHNKDVLAWYLLEGVAVRPLVVCAILKSFLEVRHRVHLVKVIENRRRDLVSAYLALRNPQEPFLAVFAFQQLHL